MRSMPKPLTQMQGNTTLPTRRQKFRAARAFYLVILIVALMTAWSLCAGVLREGGGREQQRVLKRSPLSADRSESGIIARTDQEVGQTIECHSSGEADLIIKQCRLVHGVKHQCAFVRQNCPDEEAGLFSYLQLYYCKIPRAKPVAFLILVVWLGLLFSTIGIAASDFFCINLSTIASILGMSESMAGVTFLAFGNGSPDVFSTFAAMKTHSGSLAVGELIGAAGFITAVVAGSMALVRPFKVARKSFVRDVGFFIIAASFSMIFLADGRLYLWECAVMVGFYLFYVATVVLWHWYIRRRGDRKRIEAAARGHFYVPGSDEVAPESYHDEEEESRPASGARSPLRGISSDDFAALERGGSPMLGPVEGLDPDEDDETRDHWLAEISSNMRVSRPRRGERRNTANPIRPSLVGALEFRAVLSSLQKSRNIQTIPINLRRYSDDPTYTLPSSRTTSLPLQTQTSHTRTSMPMLS